MNTYSITFNSTEDQQRLKSWLTRMGQDRCQVISEPEEYVREKNNAARNNHNRLMRVSMDENDAFALKMHIMNIKLMDESAEAVAARQERDQMTKKHVIDVTVFTGKQS